MDVRGPEQKALKQTFCLLTQRLCVRMQTVPVYKVAAEGEHHANYCLLHWVQTSCFQSCDVFSSRILVPGNKGQPLR